MLELGTGDSRNQPYHVEHTAYTPEEAMTIKSFMEDPAVDTFVLPRSIRDGKFLIENLPFPEAGEFKSLVLQELPDELDSCHPKLRRRDFYVRFVNNLSEFDLSGKDVRTHCDVLEVEEAGKYKHYIRIDLDSLQNLHGDDLIATVLSMIVHELAEEDYYMKSIEKIEDSKALLGKDGYSLTEDEEVANRRAVRLLRRIYPNAELTNVKYPIDKEA